MAARAEVPNELVPRDHDQLNAALKDLEERGFTIQGKKSLRV